MNIIERPSSNDLDFDFSYSGIEALFERIFGNYLRWKGGLIQIKKSANRSDADNRRNEAQSSHNPDSHISKRRRMRGGGNARERKNHDLVFDIEADASEIHEM